MNGVDDQREMSIPKQADDDNNTIVKVIFNKVGLKKAFMFYFLFFNHFNNLSVDQQLMTSFFVSQARRAMATP